MAMAAASCGRTPAPKQYELHGQILGVDRERGEVLVNHEDIKGFMPAMTMPYKVNDPTLLDGKNPGDLIAATLVVEEVNAYLSSIKTTGRAAVQEPSTVPAITGFDLLKEGDVVPDYTLVDQNRVARPIGSLKGHRLVLTFIYTRCPFSDFCPLMDKQFVALQQAIAAAPELRDVRLLSVTLDPDFDTPPVLEKHARSLDANPGVWFFLTGDRTNVLGFAKRFSVVAQPGETESVVVHNLRTAVIDAQGRLAKVYSGNMWAPAELVADLKATPPPAH